MGWYTNTPGSSLNAPFVNAKGNVRVYPVKTIEAKLGRHLNGSSRPVNVFVLIISRNYPGYGQIPLKWTGVIKISVKCSATGLRNGQHSGQSHQRIRQKASFYRPFFNFNIYVEIAWEIGVNGTKPSRNMIWKRLSNSLMILQDSILTIRRTSKIAHLTTRITEL